MSAISLASLLLADTKEAIYSKGLQIAAALGLPVTSWQPGDPTRSDYHFVSEVLELLEQTAALFAGSGFLDTAEGDFLALQAQQQWGVEKVGATYATCLATLTNAGGGVHVIEPGDVVVRNSTTDATFTNTTGGTLAKGPGSTLSLAFVADVAGSAASSAVGEIDEGVSVPLAVTVSNTTAAVGIDEESDPSLRQRCRDRLGALSPNGPRDAYSYVARSSELTGTSAVTRVRVYDDSTTGEVLVYVAGPAGAITGPELALVDDAIHLYATPLAITSTVDNATPLSVAVTYKLWVYAADSREEAEIEEAVEEALAELFADKPIGGDIIPPALTGSLFRSHIEATIKSVSDFAFRVSVTAPAGDTALDNDEVATLGTITATINTIDNP